MKKVKNEETAPKREREKDKKALGWAELEDRQIESSALSASILARADWEGSGWTGGSCSWSALALLPFLQLYL